jgi:hypothetical protein
MRGKAICVHCGTSLDQFLSTGLMGCAGCYSLFLTPREIFAFSRSSLKNLPELRGFERTLQDLFKLIGTKNLSLRFRIARNFRNQFYSPSNNSKVYKLIDEFLKNPEVELFSRFGTIHFFDEDHIRAEFFLQTETCESNQFPKIFYNKEIFDFHPKYGYLTACPTNSGLGNKISIEINFQNKKNIDQNNWMNLFKENIIKSSTNSIYLFLKNYKKKEIHRFLNLISQNIILKNEEKNE